MGIPYTAQFEYSPKECRIAKGWYNAGKTGQYFGKVYIEGRWWSIVLWDHDEDPTLNKSESIGIQLSDPLVGGL